MQELSKLHSRRDNSILVGLDGEEEEVWWEKEEAGERGMVLWSAVRESSETLGRRGGVGQRDGLPGVG